MPSYRHNPDGLIIITDGALRYIDTADNYTADAGAPPPALPPGMQEQYYNPAGCRGLPVRTYKASGCEYPTIGTVPELDAVIAALPSLLDAQAVRQAVEGV